MDVLSDELLIETYFMANKYGLDEKFVEILLKEFKKRGIR
ncbi:sporulation histidine kinase inhibitor Sda [Alkalihalobacillus sp. BA299]|nr:sporulation histidine kinase inhibitor Sda [Alkalihalobacillus sp. BA299]